MDICSNPDIMKQVVRFTFHLFHSLNVLEQSIVHYINYFIKFNNL